MSTNMLDRRHWVPKNFKSRMALNIKKHSRKIASVSAKGNRSLWTLYENGLNCQFPRNMRFYLHLKLKGGSLDYGTKLWQQRRFFKIIKQTKFYIHRESTVITCLENNLLNVVGRIRFATYIHNWPLQPFSQDY